MMVAPGSRSWRAADIAVDLPELSRWLPTTIVAEASSGEVAIRHRWAEAVEAAKRFIEENLGAPLDIETIAREVALSPPHFKRVFREVEGVSPWVYVTERRVRRAEELIREERPLSEIAFETGFADQSHFTRVFKRVTGRTPGAAREDDPIVQDEGDRAA